MASVVGFWDLPSISHACFENKEYSLSLSLELERDPPPNKTEHRHVHIIVNIQPAPLGPSPRSRESACGPDPRRPGPVACRPPIPRSRCRKHCMHPHVVAALEHRWRVAP
eukprot:3334966-Prymnesium_polylepis.1